MTIRRRPKFSLPIFWDIAQKNMIILQTYFFSGFSTLPICMVLIALIFNQETINIIKNRVGFNINKKKIIYFQNSVKCLQYLSLIMSSINKYLLIGSAVLIGYAAKYFSSQTLSIKQQTVRKIIREIKYQVYAFCIPFSQAIHESFRMVRPPEDIELYLRMQLAKCYQSKQELILNKYNTSKEQYSSALEKYKNDHMIEANRREIQSLLEETAKFGTIDLNVPQKFEKIQEKQILSLYQRMCEGVCLMVCKQLQESKKKDAGFNAKDQLQFKKAMKQLDTYHFRVQFLLENGFENQSDCPNFIFLKLYERLKRSSPQFKKQFTFIDTAYGKMIEVIVSQFTEYDKNKINHFFSQLITNLKMAAQPPPNSFGFNDQCINRSLRNQQVVEMKNERQQQRKTQIYQM